MSVLPYHAMLKFSEGSIDFAEFHLQRSTIDADRQRSFVPSSDKLLIMGDIRLDNRSELAVLPGCNRQTSDEELALAAYRHWGDDCAAHFIGDFAFVIWNQSRHELFCCRDHVGVKPFFYHLDARYFVFASDVAGVVAHPEVSAELSDLAVARFLGEGDLLDECLTFYASIHKLPPATTLVVSPAGTREKKYWHPEAVPPLELGSEQEYTHRLRKLLELSVTARIPSTGPVGSHLSGGLDSSAIIGIAARNMREPSARLKTWNWMRPPRSAEDEGNREWLDARLVAEFNGLTHRHVELTESALEDILGSELLLANDTVDRWYELDVREAARSEGVDVMLSGWGGDQLISFNGWNRYAHMLLQGRVYTVLRDMYAWSRVMENPFRHFLRLCYFLVWKPLAPHLLGGRRVNPPEVDRDYLEFTQGDFRAWALLRFKKTGFFKELDPRAIQLKLLSQGGLRTRLESWSVSGARAGIEYRYPLLDKRIIEFALGLPPEFYHRRGHGRYLFRRAIEDVMPDTVCWGSHKLEPVRVSEVISLMARSLKRYALKLDLAENRYIDESELLRFLKAIPDDNCHLDQTEYIVRLKAAFKSIMVIAISGNSIGGLKRQRHGYH